MNEWDKRFIRQAKEISTWSKDPRTLIGAIAVKDRRILSTGYNGFPRGVADDERLDVREIKHKYVVHAEANCIYNAVHHGVSLAGSTFYVYGLPVCNECAKGIIQSGVTRVVMQLRELPTNKWQDSYQITKEMFREAKISFEMYLLDNEISL